MKVEEGREWCVTMRGGDYRYDGTRDWNPMTTKIMAEADWCGIPFGFRVCIIY